MPTQTIMTLPQFHRMKGRPRGPIAVHLTDREWATAVKGVKYTAGKPPRGFKGLRLVATPEIGGGLVFPDCPSPCQFRRGDTGMFECVCTASNGGGTSGGRVRLNCGGWRLGTNGSIRCLGSCSEKNHSCQRLAFTLGKFVLWMSCGCRRR